MERDQPFDLRTSSLRVEGQRWARRRDENAARTMLLMMNWTIASWTSEYVLLSDEKAS